MRSASNYEILGIGTPFVDYILLADDKTLEKLSQTRGGSTVVDYNKLQTILQEPLALPRFITGGSCANTIKGLASLGNRCAIIGRIGNDPAGDCFKEMMETQGITPLLVQSNKPTAQAACLISPDGERTMFTTLGASADLNESDLTLDLFQGVRLVHIEGYLLTNEPLVRKAMALAKESGAAVSFDVSSVGIITQHKKAMIDLLTHYVDIVFANTAETKVLTGLPPEQGCVILKDLSETAIVKMGAEGCWAAQGIDKVFSPALPTKVVDTTGAGDLFASGFLHGYTHRKTLVECTHYGALVASHVIQILGAEIPPPMWKSIRDRL
ncbi:MAG: adenosine kinase [Parachlamydiaceae bacterium]